MATANTKSQPTRPQRQAAKSWSLNLPAEEEKGQLNVNIPKSLLGDLELLKNAFNTTQAALVERCLRQALSTNSDLHRLKEQNGADLASAVAAKG